MDYKEKYEQALERARQFFEKPYLEDSAGIVGYIFPELKGSEDEVIRKALIEMVHDTTGDSLWVDYNVHKEECIAWLEKQGQTFTKKDVDDAYLKGVCDTKHELEKQGERKPNPCENCDIATNNCQNFPCAIRDGEQNPTWSEEDESMLQNILECLKNGWRKLPTDILKYESWLKSLRPQNRWKPSDRQIKGIECAIKTLQHQLNVGDKRLNSLYDDLKKLREE